MGSDSQRVAQRSRGALSSEIVNPSPADRKAASLEKASAGLDVEDNDGNTRSDQLVDHSMVDTVAAKPADSTTLSKKNPAGMPGSRIRHLGAEVQVDNQRKKIRKLSKDASVPSLGGKVWSSVRTPQQNRILPILLPRVTTTSGAARITATTRNPSALSSETLDATRMIHTTTVRTTSRSPSTSEYMENHADSSSALMASASRKLHQPMPMSLPATSQRTIDPVTLGSIATPVSKSLQSSPLASSASRKCGPPPSGVHAYSPESHSTHDDLPLDIRNRKMKPTDCLLFAATLLEDASGPSLPSSRDKADTIEGLHLLRTCSIEDNPDPAQPRDVDVLCGRGGLINKHPGNIIYRRIVEYNKAYYSTVQKKHRILVSQSIVQSMLNFGCRFLASGTNDMKSWTEIDFKKAVQKTSQALREKPISQDGEEAEDEAEEVETACSLKDNQSAMKSKCIDFGSKRLMVSIASHEERSRIDTKVQVG